jgi:excisionase family DNA binding protein
MAADYERWPANGYPSCWCGNFLIVEGRNIKTLNSHHTLTECDGLTDTPKAPHDPTLFAGRARQKKTFGPDVPDVMTVKEMATWLKVSPATVYSWIRAGQLKVIRGIGRSGFRILKPDVAEFIAQRYGYVAPTAHGTGIADLEDSSVGNISSSESARAAGLADSGGEGA